MVRKIKTVTEEKQQNHVKQSKQAADNKEANKDMFSWSDDEIRWLLMAALDFKSQCEFDGMNWNSKRSKYKQILELMMKQYPITISKNYQNKNLLNKDRITAKLKSIIQTDFKKAVDTGKKSVCGRLVSTFYDLFTNFLGGSPVVTGLPFGVVRLATMNRKEMSRSL